MSFSSNAKAELCRAPISRRCCAQAEAYGVVLYCNTFRPDQLRIVTENPEFSARLPRLRAASRPPPSFRRSRTSSRRRA